MKKLSLFALSALVGSSLALGFAPQLPASATAPASATLLVTGTAGGANSGVGDSGLGQAWGVNTTLVGSTRWTVFESAASNLVVGDTNNSSDIFVTDGTTVTRLSVSASGTEGSNVTNSYDPTICASGRIVAFTTENEWDSSDANGAEDVYVIDRDADADGTFDEFTQAANALADPPVLAGVTTTLVSQSYNSDTGEYDISYLGANSGVISDDCEKVAFVTDVDFVVEDLNFGPDVYVNDLTESTTPAVWATKFATDGSSGGGFLPAISSDGSKVVVTTEATDLVSESGTVGGLVLRSFVSSNLVTTGTGTYLTRTPAGAASTGTLADSERPASITPDGACVAFKADQGYDLLANNAGPAQGIFLWDNRTGTPVISLVSKDSTGLAASSASNPRISDDCRFVAFQTDDEYLSYYDNNNETDVYLYDTVTQTSDLISTDGDGNSADGSSSVAALDWNSTTKEGVVILMSSASNIRGALGGDSTNDLFSVPFNARPNAPTSLVATAGNARATIAFTAPSSDGGSTITNYEYSTNNGTTWKAFSPTDVTTPVVITTVSTGTSALVNGTAYNVKLRAVNAVGAGSISAAVSVTPSTIAGAPTSLVATAGNAQISVAFTAPVSNGGAAITNYEYSTNNGYAWKAFSPADATTPVVITILSDATTALVNGTAYNVKLRAVNAAGAGSMSAVVTVKPGQTPAPTSLVATPGNARATIAFTAPSSLSIVGGAITNYEYSTDNGTTFKAFSPADATTPVVITIRSDAATALVNGTAYNVKLRTVNAGGVGAASSAVSVTPSTTAGAPTSLVATAGNAQISVAFTAPVSNGGAAITNYEYSTNNGYAWKAFSPADATTPVVITILSDATTALVNGTAYNVKLRAVNAAGVSTQSSAVLVTPGQASAPTSLVATPGNARATIAFTAPASDAGLAITNYEYSTNNGTTWKAFSPVDITTPVVITTVSNGTTALVNGTTYTVKLRAVNSGGKGSASVAVSVTPSTTAGAPTSLVATAGNAQISVAFTAPVSNGGAAITNYEYSTNNGFSWKAFSPADATTPVVITVRSDNTSTLVNGSTYKVLLRAVNAAGVGTASTMVTATPR
jgi:hypothetical protein